MVIFILSKGGKMKKWYKSKTINFNAMYLAIIAVLQAFGLEIPTEAVVAVQTLINIILRAVTSELVTT